ncbi:hypothetical protein AN221_26675 [Streptomyces nanshensis]|uniref:Uncharacterized protein n=1 Tax=Streptomyces nanshensis TaxID=518642 RepID=A0A1E7LN58_9ACTN|nr:hypothetical protein AN221_26675 [Streptomyces nanshensis]
MLGEFTEPQWLRVADQLTEEAVAGGEVADPFPYVVVDADREELGELLVVPDHAQRPVLGVDEDDRRLDDPPQHLGQRQFPADRHDGLQQAVEPVAGAPGLVDAALQFVQQLVEPQAREPGPPGLTGIPAHGYLRRLRGRRTAGVRSSNVAAAPRGLMSSARPHGISSGPYGISTRPCVVTAAPRPGP